MRTLIACLLAAILTTSASAGEITGNGKDVNNRGASECSFSGINDTPEGFWIEVAPGVLVQIDPGGRTQSYGSFFAQYDWFDSPSDPDARAGPFPGNLCNPSGN
jgi:hypothetical protein